MTLKGKRGLFFVGQPHHWRLWKPVFEKLEKEGMEIIYVTSTVFFPFEISIVEEGIDIKYVEDFLTDNDIEKINQRYTDLCKELSLIHKKEDVFYYLDPNSISKTLWHILKEVIGFQNLLRKYRIDIIFALHEVNRWGKLLGYLSFKKGIPFITLQEGAYYIPSFSLSWHTEYSTVNLVWGQQSVDILTSVGNAPEKNLIVGDTHLDYAIPEYAYKHKQCKEEICRELSLESEKPLILLIQGTDPKLRQFPLGKILPEIDFSSDFNFTLKLHPTAVKSYVDQLKELQEKENLRIVQKIDTYKLLSAADVCVSLGTSTLTFEAFAFNKPVIEVDYGQTPFFSKFGITPFVKSGSLNEEIKKLLSYGLTEKQRENIEKWKKYAFYKVDCNSTKRVIDAITFILQEKEFYSKKKKKLNLLPGKGEKGVSVNIPVIGNPEILKETLNRLFRFLSEEDEINLIFPKALDGFYFMLKKQFEGFQFINLLLEEKEKSSLGSLFNMALVNSKKSFLLFFKGNIVPLNMGSLIKFKENGFVSGLILDDSGKVRHLGVCFEHNNVAYHLYEGLDVEKIPLKSRNYKAINYVIGGSRNYFEKVGSFDDRLCDYYTIIDYSLRAHYEGLENFVNINSTFVHFPAPSFKENKYCHIQFYTKWRGKTEYDLMKYTEEDGVDIYELYRKE